MVDDKHRRKQHIDENDIVSWHYDNAHTTFGRTRGSSFSRHSHGQGVSLAVRHALTTKTELYVGIVRLTSRLPSERGRGSPICGYCGGLVFD